MWFIEMQLGLVRAWTDAAQSLMKIGTEATQSLTRADAGPTVPSPLAWMQPFSRMQPTAWMPWSMQPMLQPFQWPMPAFQWPMPQAMPFGFQQMLGLAPWAAAFANPLTFNPFHFGQPQSLAMSLPFSAWQAALAPFGLAMPQAPAMTNPMLAWSQMALSSTSLSPFNWLGTLASMTPQGFGLPPMPSPRETPTSAPAYRSAGGHAAPPIVLAPTEMARSLMPLFWPTPTSGTRGRPN